MKRLMNDIREVSSLLLILIIGIVFGGAVLALTYVTFGGLYALYATALARAFGFDAAVDLNWILGGTAVVFLIGAGIGLTEYWQRRRGLK